jgi:hypothetical protein
MTAEAMFARQLLGRDASDPRMRASAEFITQFLPDWDSAAPTYFWYYASLALFQHQGEPWRRWNEVLTRELLNHQRTDGGATGSWDPADEWSQLGGRLYQTAICTLMLEVYYRYLPLYTLNLTQPIAVPDDAVGVMQGVVRDGATGRPVTGATVRLDVPDGPSVTADTDDDGRYVLFVPEVPDFFAISATSDGYVPSTVSVEAAMLNGDALERDFALDPESAAVIVTEVVPEVHHLGDNRFDGRINSKFQKRSEGAAYRAEFEIAADRWPPGASRAEVRLMAKGVQRRHALFINGHILDDRLEGAPRDGSFGAFAAPFDVSLLVEGVNTLDVVAAPSDTDIDDFEFVNVQIHLVR